jgi:cytochrome c-type biogenesis protein
VSIALAILAGLASFASPCVLALVPVYIAFLGETAGGVAVRAGGASPVRGPLLMQALLFVGGFSVVFVALGISVGLLGDPLFRIDVVRQVAGIVVVLLGLVTTGVFGPLMDRFCLRPVASGLPSGRSGRSLALGALFAVGWSPCIGPVLAAILGMAASSSQAGVAAVLLLAYSAGLAIPFLAAALALPRVRPVLSALRRRHRAVEVLSGLFIVAMGLLIFSNAFANMARLFTLAF